MNTVQEFSLREGHGQKTTFRLSIASAASGFMGAGLDTSHCPCVWFLVNTADEAAAEVEFIVAHNGEELPKGEPLKHVASFTRQRENDPQTFHVFLVLQHQRIITP